jgi:RNA polymerase sigma factor (sigma-70 family)
MAAWVICRRVDFVIPVMMAYVQLSARPWPVCPSWPEGMASALRHHAFKQGRMTEREVSLPARMTALLEAVGLRRDRGAFETLFAYFAPRVKSYLLRLGASPGLAEDLAQEAMLSVWRKAALFDSGKASASTWIFTIARNLRIDAIRRERRPEYDPTDPAFVPDEEPQADTHIMREDEDARLHGALTNLSTEQIEVVQMSFFADKPHGQIAKELGLPLGTVKSRLRLAMVRIRAALGDET